LSLDLIFAIPGSTLADWQHNVEAAIDLGVPHISAYSLSFEPGTVFEAWRQKGRLDPVEEELDRAMYDWAIERLGQAGLEQYEISNFARPGYECRHNLGYWANRPYVGIGPGAASSSTGILPVRGSPNALFRVWGPGSMGVPPMSAGSSHVQDTCSTHGRDGRATSGAGRPCYGRMTHDPDIERYAAAIESGGEIPGEVQPVSWEDALCETAVLGLRMRSGIDLAAFARRTGCDPIQTFAEPIRRYGDLGLIEVADGSIRLTARALPIADTILCDFAALG
jgi:oxygen-independent coproporphyrinogen-3 oxidase